MYRREKVEKLKGLKEFLAPSKIQIIAGKRWKNWQWNNKHLKFYDRKAQRSRRSSGVLCRLRATWDPLGSTKDRQW